MIDLSSLTERQRKWATTVREGFERDTGKTVEAWAEIARACPETAHRKRRGIYPQRLKGLVGENPMFLPLKSFESY